MPREAWDICDRLPIKATRYTLRDDFDQARKALGLAHVHFHDLRHTYASWLIQAGADLLAVKHLLGHSTMQMTSRYAHLEDRQLTKAVRRISGERVIKARKNKEF